MRYLYFLTATLSLTLALPISDVGTQEHEITTLEQRAFRNGVTGTHGTNIVDSSSAGDGHVKWDDPLPIPVREGPQGSQAEEDLGIEG